jgi:uncharacterized protein YggE
MRPMVLAGLLSVLAAPVFAQSQVAPRFEGSLIQMTGQAEIDVANDEAVANFFVELQDADLARAQSMVNQRVAEGVAALKKGDPRAQVETSGYASYPVYAAEPARSIVAWRVRQSVILRTSQLDALPRTVAAAQKHIALAGIDFRLSRAARERVEAELIGRAIASLNARVAAAAQALAVPPARIRIEELNFGVPGHERPPIVAFARAASMTADRVEEPALDAGRSTQQMTVTAKIRFLAP